MNRFTSFLLSQSEQAKSLSFPARLIRVFLILTIFAIPTLLCGFLVSFKAAFQMWTIVLVTIVPLVAGFYLILKYQSNNQKLSFILGIALLGFVAFLFSFFGMLFDEDMQNQSVMYIFPRAALLGILFSVFSSVISLVLSKVVSNR